MARLPEALDTRPCAACTSAGCCVRYRVVVSPADVHRLVRETSLSPLDIVGLHADPTGDVRLNAGEDRYLLCLAKRPGDGGNPCALLVGEPGHYRCSVHPSRPMVCRSFPLRPTRDGGYVAVGDPCPPVWGPEHVLDDARRLHGLWGIERELGAMFVERWNRIAACAPPGRSRSPRMLHYWILEVFGRLDAALRPWTSTPDGLDALIAGWAAPGAWTVGIEASFEILDDALAKVR